MAQSMTGYGRGQKEGYGKRITVEIRALNHRFLEIGVKLPRVYIGLEEKIKNLIKTRVARGRIDTYINVEETMESQRHVKVDKELAIAYYESLRDLGKTLEIPANINVYDICQLPDIITISEGEIDVDAFWAILQEAVTIALDELVMMRRKEGQQLAEDLISRKERLWALTEEIHTRSPYVVEDHRRRLEGRLQELLEEIPVDGERIAMEMAILAERSDITEELVRLKSHLEQLAKTINESKPIGRKLDFLVQEIHREINTIGAKANDLEINRKVVDAKSELEKIREQVQNLE